MTSAARQPDVDSREYAFPYLIRSAKDVPADFPIPAIEQFRSGLFLPRDGPDWFGRRAYPPRILLLDSNAILVLTHPRYNQPSLRLALPDIVFYEIGHLLLIGWIRLVSTRSAIHLPYNTGSGRPVSQFLNGFAKEYLAGGMERGDEATVTFGPPLDIKFGNCLTAAMRPGERLRAMWFSPSHQVSRRWGPFRIRADVGGDLMACTDQRFFWITDRSNARYERYGSVVSTAPFRAVVSARCERFGNKCALKISLRSGPSWSIPFPSERYAGAEAFTRRLENEISGTWRACRSEAAQI